MNKIVLGSVALVMALCTASAAFAEDATKKAKPTVCEAYSVAGQFGVCNARKAGGKPTLLRTYSIVTVNDPDGKPVKVMVGYR